MGCIIQSQKHEVAYFSTRKLWWVIIRPSGNVEDIKNPNVYKEDPPKLKRGKNEVFLLTYDGWIIPTDNTIMNSNWRSAAIALIGCFEGLVSHDDVFPSDWLLSGDRHWIDFGWRARLSPFLVKHFRYHYQMHDDYYPGLALQFYPKWERGEEGKFLKLTEPDDWSWVGEKNLPGDLEDPGVLEGFWNWVKQGDKKSESGTLAHVKKKGKSGSSRKRRITTKPRRGLSSGNLTRNKESMSNSDNRAKSRDLDNERT